MSMAVTASSIRLVGSNEIALPSFSSIPPHMVPLQAYKCEFCTLTALPLLAITFTLGANKNSPPKKFRICPLGTVILLLITRGPIILNVLSKEGVRTVMVLVQQLLDEAMLIVCVIRQSPVAYTV